MGENHFAAAPTALYGIVLLMAAIAYWLLQQSIVADQGEASLLAAAIGRDLKGKLSPILYAAAVPLAFFDPRMSQALYVLVALMWLVPDRRIVRALRFQGAPKHPVNDGLETVRNSVKRFSGRDTQ